MRKNLNNNIYCSNSTHAKKLICVDISYNVQTLHMAKNVIVMMTQYIKNHNNLKI